MTARAQTVTIFFSNLGGSIELLQSGGVEEAHRISMAHHRLLRDAGEDLAGTAASVTFEDRGEHALKGIVEPQHVFAVRASEAG